MTILRRAFVVAVFACSIVHGVSKAELTGKVYQELTEDYLGTRSRVIHFTLPGNGLLASSYLLENVWNGDTTLNYRRSGYLTYATEHDSPERFTARYVLWTGVFPAFGEPVEEGRLELKFEGLDKGTAPNIVTPLVATRFRTVDLVPNGYVETNSSSRSRLSEGRSIILGFMVPDGGAPFREVLVRGSARSLERFGVSDFAGGTRVSIFRDQICISKTSDESWDVKPESFAQLNRAFSRFGAFYFDRGSNEQALAVLLKPGVYTAVVSLSKGSHDGEVLGEVYVSK